jgi:DNA-directed RNA polymerase delta subunit.
MKLSSMKKEQLELLTKIDLTKLILEDSKKTMTTAELFKEIIRLLELPASTFENKVADYYTALSTDKNFILLDDGKWDLRSHHKSDKVIVMDDEDDEEELDTEDEIEQEEEDDLSNVYSEDDDFGDDSDDDDFKNLVVVDEDELEM